MHFSKFTFAVIVCFVSGQALALSGNEYRKLSIEQRLIWTVGAADGILAEQLFATNAKPPMVDCLAKLERDQIQAIFEKGLDSQPERWQYPAAFVFRQTFMSYCGQ